MCNLKHTLESAAIILIGLWMHVHCLSAMELGYTKTAALAPNAASVLFVLSVLCILTKLRPIWPRCLERAQRAVLFFCELSLIVYATEILVRHAWVPMTMLLCLAHQLLGQCVLEATEDIQMKYAPLISSWIQHEAFLVARFAIALALFTMMIEATGLMEFVRNLLRLQHMFGGTLPCEHGRLQIRSGNVPERSVQHPEESTI